MTKPQLVNFHYEHQLFDSSLVSEKSKNINQDFEYIALLWGGVESLYTYSTYTKDYLDDCRQINPLLPQLIPYQNQKDYEDFWGSTKDFERMKKLNSKVTSFQLGQELKLNPAGGQIIEGTSKLEEALEKSECPLVLRLNSSIAGRGVFRFSSLPEIREFFEKRHKKIWLAGPVIFEPKYERIKDFGVLFREKISFYENVIDHRGQFRGIIIRPEEEFFSQLELKMSLQSFKKVYQDIFEAYQQKGIWRPGDLLQIDSFTYKDSKDEVRLYPLVEVNARKTMGEFALRIHQKIAPQSEYGIFYLLKHQSTFVPTDALRLSPKESQHLSYFASYSQAPELESALKIYLDDISYKPRQ